MANIWLWAYIIVRQIKNSRRLKRIQRARRGVENSPTHRDDEFRIFCEGRHGVSYNRHFPGEVLVRLEMEKW